MKNKIIVAFFFLLIQVSGYSQQLPFFKWDLEKSPLPVTNFNFNNDSGLVQFAILSDRTGGMNPGVYEDAVEKANLLQPQFILSVGDLINGYSTDEKLINAQWKEFNDILTPLTVPFFYVPGNHDISNAWMQKEWERRYGRSHYYFIYKNALFLCLNSQDGGDYGMKEEQVNYFLDVIKNHTDVKWTFLFMHQPLWAKQQTGFEKIEAALQQRRYTVFAGHTHNYLLSYRNNQKYFILATTGGGTGNRGEKFGEFNHITWVTLNSTEPKIVNIKLDGIIKEDIVDEPIKKAIRPLTSGNWLQVYPYRAPVMDPATLSPVIQLKNTGESSLRVQGKMPEVDGLKFEPASIDITVPAGAEQKLNYTISGSRSPALHLQSMPPIAIELTGEYMINNNSYALPAKKRLLIDWPHASVKLSQPVADFSTARPTAYIDVTQPEYIEEAWDWHGTDDAGIRFAVSHSDQSLYLNTIIKDDHFIFQPGDHRDKIFIYLEDKTGKPVKVTVFPDYKKSTISLTGADGKPYPLKPAYKTSMSGNQLQLQIALPLKPLLKTDATVRLNIGYADQDDANSLECATLYWKPLWQSSADYDKSGTFVIK